MRMPRIKNLSSDEQISHDSDAATCDGEKAASTPTLLIVSLRIWGTTLFILALPVLGIATFHAASTGKSPSPATAELCETSVQAPAARVVVQDRIQGTD